MVGEVKLAAVLAEPLVFAANVAFRSSGSESVLEEDATSRVAEREMYVSMHLAV